MSRNITITAISGSLRAASNHTALLRAVAELSDAQHLGRENVTVNIITLNDIPMYNQDDEADGFPASVIALREAIASADGILLACPEYNGSVTGALKNAIDWASRQGNVLGKKPVATLGGSPAHSAQPKRKSTYAPSAPHLGMYLMTRPTIAVPQFNGKIEDGKLVDEQTREFMTQFLQSFTAWIELTNPA